MRDEINPSEIERPLDLLNALKGRNVLVRIKDQDVLIKGKLLAFDIHINIVLDNGKLEFVRGDNIISIC